MSALVVCLAAISIYAVEGVLAGTYGRSSCRDKAGKVVPCNQPNVGLVVGFVVGGVALLLCIFLCRHIAHKRRKSSASPSESSPNEAPPPKATYQHPSTPQDSDTESETETLAVNAEQPTTKNKGDSNLPI